MITIIDASEYTIHSCEEQYLLTCFNIVFFLNLKPNHSLLNKMDKRHNLKLKQLDMLKSTPGMKN